MVTCTVEQAKLLAPSNLYETKRARLKFYVEWQSGGGRPGKQHTREAKRQSHWQCTDRVSFGGSRTSQCTAPIGACFIVKLTTGGQLTGWQNLLVVVPDIVQHWHTPVLAISVPTIYSHWSSINCHTGPVGVDLPHHLPIAGHINCSPPAEIHAGDKMHTGDKRPTHCWAHCLIEPRQCAQHGALITCPHRMKCLIDNMKHTSPAQCT